MAVATSLASPCHVTAGHNAADLLGLYHVKRRAVDTMS
jgi:hypothetical protein